VQLPLTKRAVQEIHHKKVKLPKRSNKGKYDDRASLKGMSVVPEKY